MTGDAERSGVLSLDVPGDWDALVQRCMQWDVYHLAGYHRIAATTDGGEPRLFWFESSGFVACLPYLKRPLPAEVSEGTGLSDAISAYGYPGPISSLTILEGQAHRAAFQERLLGHLRHEGIVSMFIRHESRCGGAWLLDGVGDTAEAGDTVWIDLAADAAARAASSSSSHRYEVRRAMREGLTIVEARDVASVDEFADMYLETMIRLKSSAYYRFDRAYFRELFTLLGENTRLFLAENMQGRRVAGAVVFQAGDLLQYHLSGRVGGKESEFAMRLVLHEAAERGSAEGKRSLHLGGGLGGRHDGLFRFKAGFSSARGHFLVSRCILDEPLYKSLCSTRERRLMLSGDVILDPEYFPRYRAPAGRPG
jgi:hypothetical protein